jgi:four helix bundle protein
MVVNSELTFAEWMKAAPARLQADPLWQSTYYRLAMYLYDLVWKDCEVLHRDFRGRTVVDQLIRSLGGVCANVEEAYGRGVGSADYVRILRIALGEARETQGWLFRSRHMLPNDLLERRLDVVGQIIALLVSTIASHRQNLKKV